MKLTARLHLVPRLRMCGTIPPLHQYIFAAVDTSSWKYFVILQDPDIFECFFYNPDLPSFSGYSLLSTNLMDQTPELTYINFGSGISFISYVMIFCIEVGEALKNAPLHEDDLCFEHVSILSPQSSTLVYSCRTYVSLGAVIFLVHFYSLSLHVINVPYFHFSVLVLVPCVMYLVIKGNCLELLLSVEFLYGK